MSEPRLLSVLVPAVGGQGGGVLAEWLVEATQGAGLVAHGTSIPGVAQRTGSTTYYVEVYTGRDVDAPAFSLYPIPGALDVLLAPEFLEVGRAIELGFPSPDRTTIIASTHRLYSIHEKIATGRNIYPTEQLEAGARAFSTRLVAFDALAVAREHGTEVNAVLLGALAGSEALPIPAECFREAIRQKGIQVDANLRGFEVGLGLARQRPEPRAPEARRPLRTPAGLEDALARLPEEVRGIAGEGAARLIDYQDAAYARKYLDRLAPFVSPAGDAAVAAIVARYLALWMAYEDAIRVADLKTRAGRFARIREEARARNATIVVTDYLEPDLDELYGILPDRLVAPFARWAERRWPHGRPTLGQHVKTTTVAGFLRLWLLGRMRWLRPGSHRARIEHERIERWLGAVAWALLQDAALAAEVARAGQLVKGYGEVRRRMAALLDALLDGIRRAAEAEVALEGSVRIATELAAAYRRLVLRGPEGEDQARALIAAVLERLQAKDVQAAAGCLTSAG